MKIIKAGIIKYKSCYILISVFSAIAAFLVMCHFVLHMALDATFENTYREISGPICEVIVDDDESAQNVCEILDRKTDLTYEVFNRHVTKGLAISNKEYPYAYVVTGESIVPNDGFVCVNSTGSDIKKLTFKCNGESREVEKFVIDSINSAPEKMNLVIYVDENEYEKLLPYGINQEKVINVYGNANELGNFIDEYQESIKKPFKGNITSFDDIKNSYLFRYKLIDRYMEPVSVIIYIFMIIILGLIINIVILGDEKRTEILRFIGMKKTRVMFLYIFQNSLPTVVGAFIGIALGFPLLNFWLKGMFRALNDVNFSIHGGIGWAILSASIVLVVEIVVTVTIQFLNELRIKNIDKKEGEKKKLRIQGGILTKFSKSREMAALGLSYATGHKIQSGAIVSATAFLGSIIAFTVFTELGIMVRNDHLSEWGIAEMDIYVSRAGGANEKDSGLLDYLDENENIKYYYAALSDTVYFKSANSSGNVIADIFDKNILKEMDDTLVEGHNPEKTDEVAVGMKFSRNNDLSVGDTIEVTYGSNSRKYTICGIYSSFKDNAYSIRYFVDDIITYFDNKADGYYSIVLKDKNALSTMITDLSKFIDFRFIPMKRGIRDTIYNMIIPLLIVLMILVGTYVTVIGVLLTMMLTNRKSELETYTYFGATRGDLCTNVRYSIITPSIIGIIIAIPTAIFFIPQYFKNVVFELGLVKVPIYNSFWSICFSVIVLLILILAVLRKNKILKPLLTK